MHKEFFEELKDNQISSEQKETIQNKKNIHRTIDITPKIFFDSLRDACFYFINALEDKPIDQNVTYSFTYRELYRILYGTTIFASVYRKKWKINVGIIYVITDGVGYKIGKAKIGSKRFTEYTKWREEQKGIIYALVYDYEKFEKNLQKKYINNNIRGEWYKFSDEELQEVVEYIKSNSYETSSVNIYSKIPSMAECEKKYAFSKYETKTSNSDDIYKIIIDENGRCKITNGHIEFIQHRIRTKNFSFLPDFCPDCGGDDFYIVPGKANNGTIRCKKCNRFIKNASYGDCINLQKGLEYKKDKQGNYILSKYYTSIKIKEEDLNKIFFDNNNITLFSHNLTDGVAAINSYITEQINCSSEKISECCNEIQKQKSTIIQYNKYLKNLLEENAKMHDTLPF